jgi:hypothetical protein
MENQKHLTEVEKQIFNKHLIVSRTERNKPARIRKNFDDIVDTDKHLLLKRISNLFRKHPDLDQNLFFKAPYKLYPDVEYFGLDYFSSMRAIKSYTIYKKQLFLQDPDSQIEDVKKSLKFIANFCIDTNIYLHQYPYHKNTDLFSWMQHYKENKINIYVMMEFADVYAAVRSLSEDLQKFFVGEFVEQFHNLYSKYNNSNDLKKYLKKAIPVISKFVEDRVDVH